MRGKPGRYSRDYEHVVMDTEARPEQEDLKALVNGCDLLVIPTCPNALSMDALLLTVEALHRIGADRFRILLTIIPPKPSRDGNEAMRTLKSASLPGIQTGASAAWSHFQKAALAGVPVYDVTKL